MDQLKKFLTQTAIDLACIIPMVLQVFYPTDPLFAFTGNIGYAAQIFFILTALVFLPILLLAHTAMQQMLKMGHPATQDQRFRDAIVAMHRVQDKPRLYQRLSMGRELAFCLVFSGFGWIWLALGNLLALFLMCLFWGSAKLEAPEAA